MRFLDLHCDTVTECRSRGLSLENNAMHLDYARGSRFDQWVQTFAVWIPDTLRGADAWQYFEDNYDFFSRFCDQSALPVVRSSDALHQALSDGGRAAVLAVEGGAVLGGEISRLYDLYDRGVRLMTLTWNGENELAFGCQSQGGRLKLFGRQVVSAMEKLRMIVDVSHLDRAGFYDVLEMTERPVLASHSTSASVLEKTRADSTDKMFSIRRALDDRQILALRSHGGLIGLNFCGSFLGDPGDDGVQAALRHAAHIVELGGEEMLSIGSDFDGCTMHADLAGIDKMPALYEAFLQNGFGRALCEKIFFENGLHFFKNML
ncbi:MAG: membrane dipeptidase [Clostridia bacterium]|nr:membrane dipeptidase [Clostridia bacterium]